MKMTLEERIWAKVDKSGDCWLWNGTLDTSGYGSIKVNGRQRGVHRVVYELTYGEIPAGKILRHTCDTPRCVRPDHLIPGTIAENRQDCVARNRHAWPVLLGARNPRSKLTQQDVDAIRAEYQQNKTPYQELAARYGVSKYNIRSIVLGKHWKQAQP